MSNPYKPNQSSSYKVVSPGSGSDAFSTESNISRMLPRQLSTGSTRGTQTVGYGNTKIDGSNNRITIGTPDGGVIGFGSIPGSTTNEFGFFSQTANGHLSMKIIDGTFYTYDETTGLNTVQMGTLPDGTGGIAGANQGFNVADGFN